LIAARNEKPRTQEGFQATKTEIEAGKGKQN
jgi:hypothetical protein